MNKNTCCNHSWITIGDAVGTQSVIQLVYDWCTIVVHQLVVQLKHNKCIIGEASDTVKVKLMYNWWRWKYYWRGSGVHLVYNCSTSVGDTVGAQ